MNIALKSWSLLMMPGACIGLITVKDMEKAQNHPLASKDDRGRLLVAAATGAGPDGIRRAEALIAAGADVIVVDTAHGHSEGVLESVTAVRKLANHVQIIGGNVATADGAKALIDSGADAVKVGIGPGSICTDAHGCRCWRATIDRDHGCG
jgi:IMP dehydrogenase